MESLYSSFILTDRRIRALEKWLDVSDGNYIAEMYLFSSSLRPASGHDANMLLVRFALLRSRGSRGGRAARVIPSEAKKRAANSFLIEKL